ncbi:centrosomal protein of 68 kDa isoform X2 [Nelusetta ayraudi]|uniref:centrosomal protein of 68 kDa isoform X2 n=1 Tax=Nelusetta ayraudi TaxID=303726 RepID=UPI003F7260C0
MESLESTRRWREPLPDSEPSRRGGTERAQDREGPGVCHTPASRWRLTDRQYSVRRPLFASEHCASSSVKTRPPPHTEKVSGTEVTRTKDPHCSILSPSLHRLSLGDPAPPPLSRLELSSTPTVPGLSLRLQEQTSQSPSSSHRLSSSVLEVQRLNRPLRPPLSSTVLYPTYRPRWGASTASGQAQPRLGALKDHSLGSPGGPSQGPSKSPHQENYWTCAIPKGLPPSPDRRSADWDPNAEYEDLLDYAYPLRPGRGAAVARSDRSSRLKHPPAGPDLQDSGIGLDHTCSSSTSLSPLCLATTGAGNWRTLSAGQRSPDLRAFSESPDCLLSDADRTAWSLDSEDAGKCERTPPTSPSHASVPAFTGSSPFLPGPGRGGAEVDEEFWPLPEQLDELQLLSRQVREVAAELSQPLTSGQRSPSPKATLGSSSSSSFRLLQRGKAEAEAEGGGGSDQTDSGASRRSGPREVQTNVAQFSGRRQPGRQENREESDSLLQHIQVFCSHLEELIRQLYAEAERTKPLAVPTAAVHNAKTWLDECQTFQQDLGRQQPITSSVLSRGQLLLRCINSMSPFLRDTLLLIEQRSGLLPPSLQSTLVPHNQQDDPGLLAV